MSEPVSSGARSSSPSSMRPPVSRPSSMREPTANSMTAPRLRRQSTFVNNRPVSVPATSNASPSEDGSFPNLRLRRGSTFSHELPQPTEAEQFMPRLRRGSSFKTVSSSPTEATSSMMPPRQNPAPRLRRGSTVLKPNSGGAAPVLGMSGNTAGGTTFLRRAARGGAAGALPRAGTFAFGADGHNGPKTNMLGPRPTSTKSLTHTQFISHSQIESNPAITTENDERSDRTCGMCGSCRTGSKSMPPWAPERLRDMSEEDRMTVLAELRAKEEMGRLDAELRAKKIKSITNDGGERQSLRRIHGSPLVYDATDSSSFRTPEKQADNNRMSSSSHKPRRRNRPTASTATPNFAMEDDDDDDNDGYAGAESDTEAENTDEKMDATNSVNEPTGEDCDVCDSLEEKVVSLEQQLEVLREVVELCSQNEAALLKEKEQAEAEKSLKRSKTWMGRIPNPFQSNATASSERSKLKEEVDVLRKATDYLFQKLESPSRK